MEWLTGFALLPALVCAVMMGGMALGALFGLRRTHHDSATSPTPPTSNPARDTDELEEAAR
jgi:hypothetical protein